MDLYAASLRGQGVEMERREVLYMLAVGQYRTGEYVRSRQLLDQALQVTGTPTNLLHYLLIVLSL